MNGFKLFTGWVSHHRSHPKTHRFRYRLFQIWLDIEKVHKIDSLSRWWSTQRFNLVRFKRQRYLPSELSLYKQVQKTIEQQTKNEFQGKAYLLASLDYWGYGYNPVSFICCYEDDELRYLIAEVHNTPWGERFCYVHDIANEESQINGDREMTQEAGGHHLASFDKAFHVSPFMPMELEYQWKYKVTDSQFHMSMNLFEADRSIFNATLKLNGEPLTKKQANRIPFRYPFSCINTLRAIYWQALKLWIKKIPYHPYPKEQS